MKVERHVFVDAKDVREQDTAGFFGIAPGKLIRLKYGPAIRITSVGKQGSTLVVKGERLSAEEAAKEATIKGVLNWLAKGDAHPAEFRLYENLFKVPKPELDAENAEARRKEINFDSAHFYPKALINKGLLEKINKDSRFQFERLGFFSVDLDTNFGEKKYVFNRILESQSKLKEDKAKAPKAK